MKEREAYSRNGLIRCLSTVVLEQHEKGPERERNGYINHALVNCQKRGEREVNCEERKELWRGRPVPRGTRGKRGGGNLLGCRGRRRGVKGGVFGCAVDKRM